MRLHLRITPKRPVEILGYDLIGFPRLYKEIGTKAVDCVKMVCGTEGILHEESLYETLQKLYDKGAVMHMLCQATIARALKEDYPKKSLRKKFLLFLKNGTLEVYGTPSRPHWHFIVIDGRDLLLQKSHIRMKRDLVSQVPQLRYWYVFRGGPVIVPMYDRLFDTWIRANDVCRWLADDRLLKEIEKVGSEI